MVTSNRAAKVLAVGADRSRRFRLAMAFGLLALGAALIVAKPVAAQNNDAELLSAEALDELVGPIALYPDDLVAIVLPASTYPLQIAQAAKFLEDRKRNSNLEPDEDWDDSVVALLNYPEVVELMNEDLDWTWELGEAVLNQRTDVLAAIQSFRDRAYAAGNLKTDNRQVVTEKEGVIEIEPADPEVIYVPYYEPRRVVVYQSAPVYHYYPIAYPVYFYPYPVGYHFHSGFFWGVTTAFSIGWHSHYVHAYPWNYFGHPFYGYHYHDPFYVRHGVNINVNVININREGYVWQPTYRRAARPFTRSSGHPATVAGTSPIRHDAAAPATAHSRYRTATSPQTRSFARPTNSASTAQRTTPRANSDATRSPELATRSGTTARTTPSTTTPGSTVRVHPRSGAQREAAPAVRAAPQPQQQNGGTQYRGGGRAIARPAEQPAAPRYETRSTPAPQAAPQVSRGTPAAPQSGGGRAISRPTEQRAAPRYETRSAPAPQAAPQASHSAPAAPKSGGASSSHRAQGGAPSQAGRAQSRGQAAPSGGRHPSR